MKYSNIILTALLMVLTIMPAIAQGAPPATPIDGGLSLLLAAGGAYGVSRIRKATKGNNPS